MASQNDTASPQSWNARTRSAQVTGPATAALPVRVTYWVVVCDGVSVTSAVWMLYEMASTSMVRLRPV